MIKLKLKLLKKFISASLKKIKKLLFKENIKQ